jgi:hypothetical protein
MDNLQILRDRVVENSKPNPYKYGLVKQIGPFDPTPADRYNTGLPPIHPRRMQMIEPDAVPNGVKDELSWMPIELGGGFSMRNGSVVQEAIYDARITAPGQKVMGVPLEGPGVLKALQSSFGRSYQTMMPTMPGKQTPSGPSTSTQISAEPQWVQDLKNWDNLRERKKLDLIKRYAGGNEKYFVDIIPKFTEDEKIEFATASRNYFNRSNNVPPKCIGRGRPCTDEERKVEQYWEQKYQEQMLAVLGFLVDVLL